MPGAALLLVGAGPYERDAAPAGRDGTASRADVVFTGAVAEDELPAHYAAGDVFAMPCRTRRGGADVEGLGIVYLEASATGLPVVAGDSGGAPDAVRAGETGYVVDGRDQRRDRRSARRAARRSGAARRGWARPAGPGSSATGSGTRSRDRLRALLDG